MKPTSLSQSQRDREGTNQYLTTMWEEKEKEKEREREEGLSVWGKPILFFLSLQYFMKAETFYNCKPVCHTAMDLTISSTLV